MDPPRTDTFRGRRVTTAHLISTLHGEAGTAELCAFARDLGMDLRWIQHRGTPKEHFDLLGVARCEAAQRAGAVVDRTVLGLALRAKRLQGGAHALTPLQPGGDAPPASGAA